jgi:dTDP-4-dehydrorhamnose reductase
MKIIVLGSSGMLGKYVEKYLNKNHTVITLGRSQIDASKSSEIEIINQLKKADLTEGDTIINCIGTIKPRVDELGDLNAIKVNSVFPRILSNSCEKLKLNLIHPTTDCVYTGLKGKYSEDDNYDVYDVYGMSKAMGEPSNCSVIRTSIIGEEVSNGRSLIEWIKSEKNNSVFGFTNHYWNGVTCLQFAKICEKIIKDNLFWKGTKHFHSNTLNKLDLVKLISSIFELNINVNPKETNKKCDRSLSSKFPLIVKIPSLENQIKNLKDFSIELYS